MLFEAAHCSTFLDKADCRHHAGDAFCMVVGAEILNSTKKIGIPMAKSSLHSSGHVVGLPTVAVDSVLAASGAFKGLIFAASW